MGPGSGIIAPPLPPIHTHSPWFTLEDTHCNTRHYSYVNISTAIITCCAAVIPPHTEPSSSMMYVVTLRLGASTRVAVRAARLRTS